MTAREFDKIGGRIGLLGGTFDPVHNGHLAAAQAVYSSLKLDSIVFIPAFRPPHKYHLPLSPFSIRSTLLELALSDFPCFHISYIEGQRNGPSFTCDTLVDVRGQAPLDAQLFFIIGVDAFQEIHTWKRYQTLPQYADLVIITRPPCQEEAIRQYVAASFPSYYYHAAESTWKSPSQTGKIHLLPMSPVNISSSQIRQRVKTGLDVDGLVAERVAAYVKENGLYANHCCNE